MDLFGKKRIAELEKTNANLNRRLEQWENDESKKIVTLEASELRLMGQIRDMDQLIFEMSQQNSWDQQRPIFNRLHKQTQQRQQLESFRIESLLIPEMKKAYR